MRNVFGFNEEVPLVVEGDDFPTLNGTLHDYWRSDKGVTLSGGAVTSWTGQISSNNFAAGTTGGPTVSGSNSGFNNIDTLTFNGTSAGLGLTTSNLQGTNTGSVHIAIYGAPHGDGGGFGAVFGVSTDGNSPLVNEAVMKATSTSVIEMYGFPGGQIAGSSDDTYGKGIYTITMGDPSGLGTGQRAVFLNKNNNTENAVVNYSSFTTARQPFLIGAYNALNNADLYGKVDIAGCVIWYNSYGSDFEDDIQAIESYFQGIYG